MKQIIVAYERPSQEICQNTTLAGVRDTVLALIEQYGEDAGWDLDSGYSNTSEQITFKREETDREYQERLKYEERARKAKVKDDTKKVERELKEYKRLHKKYGEKK